MFIDCITGQVGRITRTIGNVSFVTLGHCNFQFFYF